MDTVSSDSMTVSRKLCPDTPVCSARLFSVPVNSKYWKMLVACLGSLNRGLMHTALRGGWRQRLAAHMKAACVEVLGLRRGARVTRHHETWFMSLADNLVSGMAFDRHRTSVFAFRSLVARSAAYQIGSEMRWRHRYIESERNNTDYDSWAVDRDEIGRVRFRERKSM